MPSILVVDDEPKIVRLVADYLTDAGFAVTTARSGDEALMRARTESPDLVVLDLGLPGLDGLDVTRALRRSGELPIIMLTARDDETDRIIGLELGADDYVTKPFSPRELVARVRAVLRRHAGSAGAEVLRAGDLVLDVPRMRTTRGDVGVDLTATEFSLLAALARQPGRVFTRSQLLDAIHGEAFAAYERAIDAHVKNIRRKLEPEPHAPRYLLDGVRRRDIALPSDDSGRQRHRGWGRGPTWREGRRPRWWPEGEEWPPKDEAARHRMSRRFARRAGCFVLAVIFMVVLMVATVIWLLTMLFGQGWFSAVIAIAVVLVVALLLRGIWRGVRLSVAPMGDLIDASERIEAGEVGTQVEVRGPREIRAMGRAFNAMSSRLAADTEARRRLLADVSHELRTPISIIQGNVEGMIDGLYPPDRVHLERVLAETRHLERLIEDLRTLSLADAGALPLHREPVDLYELAADAVEGFQPQAAASGVTLSVEGSAAPMLDLDPRRIRQVIGNLLSNALRHTPSGGSGDGLGAIRCRRRHPRSCRYGRGDGCWERRTGIRSVLAGG